MGDSAWEALAGCSVLSAQRAPQPAHGDWAWIARLLDADDERREVNFDVRGRAGDGHSYLVAELRAVLEERGGSPELRFESRSRATGAVTSKEASRVVLDAVTTELRRMVDEAASSPERSRSWVQILLSLLAALIVLDRVLEHRRSTGRAR